MVYGLQNSLVRISALLAKEFKQLLRDPRMRFFVFIPPMIQLMIFAYAATFDVHDAKVAVLDQAKSADSRDIIYTLESGNFFKILYYQNMRDIKQAMDKREFRAIVVIPSDFASNHVLQLIADGSDSNSALLIVGQLKQTLFDHMQTKFGMQFPIRIEERAWYNKNFEDRAFFVPGIIANVLLISTLILIALTVIRERELGTLERLMVTPIARFEFILAKILPITAIGLFDVLLITSVAVLWFDVPFRGSLLALIVGSLLFLASTLGLGLLISSYSSTQQQALLTSIFVVMPAIILSGFAYPIENMPYAVQIVTYIDPLRYYLEVIRDIFLKGGSIMDHTQEYIAMTLIGLTAMGLSLLRLRHA